jgi:hypothetical protein
MAGLFYKITADYAGEAEIKKFRKDVAALKTDLAAVAKSTKDLGGLVKATAVAKARAKAQVKTAAATKKEAAAARVLNKELKATAARFTELDAGHRAFTAQARAARDAASAAKKSARAVLRVVAAQKQLQIAAAATPKEQRANRNEQTRAARVISKEKRNELAAVLRQVRAEDKIAAQKTVQLAKDKARLIQRRALVALADKEFDRGQARINAIKNAPFSSEPLRGGGQDGIERNRTPRTTAEDRRKETEALADSEARIAKIRASSADSAERAAKAIREAKVAQTAASRVKVQQSSFAGLNNFANRTGARVEKTLVSIGKKARGAARSLNAAVDATRNLQRTGESANGPFVRLFRTMVAYAAVRAIFTGISRAIRGAINFSKELEDSTLGVQAVLTSVARIATPTGIASGMEALTAAGGIAREQLAQLRAEGLRTSATFLQLAQTFQVAVGPGLRAGLDLGFVREFTVSISQAAAAIGLAQDQLNEEIRSILTGNISQRRTRIAAVLGISNEDIKNAKSLGTLTEFLTKKFDAFKFSGEAALKNFSQVIANLQEAVEIVGGEGTQALFDGLKESANELQQSLVISDGNGVIISPQAVRVVKNLTQFLADAVEEVQRLASGIGIEGFVILSDVFRQITTLIVSVLAPTMRVVSSAALIFASALRLALEVGRQLNAAFVGIPGAIAEGLVVLLALTASARVFALLWKPVLISLAAVKTALTAVLGSMVAVTATGGFAFAPFVILLATVVALGASFDELFSRFESFRKIAIKGLAQVAALAQTLSGDSKGAEQIKLQARLLTDIPKLTKKAREAIIANGDLDLLPENSEGAFEDVRPLQDIATKAFDAAFQGLKDLITEAEELPKTLESGAAALAAISDTLEEAIKPAQELNNELALLSLDDALGGGGSGFSDAAKGALKLTQNLAPAIRETEILEARIETLKDAALGIQAAGNNASPEGQQAFADLVAARASLEALEEDINKVRAQGLSLIEAQAAASIRAGAASLAAKAAEARANLTLQKELSTIATGNPQAEALREAAGLRNEMQGLAVDQQQLLQQANDLEDSYEAQDAVLRNAGASVQTLTNLATERDLKEQEISNQYRAQALEVQRLAQTLAELEQRESNFGIAFIRGIGEGVESTNEIFTTLGEGLTGTVRDSLLLGAEAAFAGELTTESLDQWATQAGEKLKAQLAAAIVEAFLINPVLEGIGNLFKPKADPAAIAQLTASTRLAFVTDFNSVIVDANSALLVTNTAALGTLTAAVLASASSAPVDAGVGSAAGGGIGGGVSGDHSGGFTGFNEGGGTTNNAPSLPSAPKGFHPADKIPALLSRNEFVASEAMEKRNPGLFGFLESLRRGGKATALGMASLPNFNTPSRATGGLKGFADGGISSGSVNLPGAAANSQKQTDSLVGQGPQFTPILVTDGADAERLISGQKETILSIAAENPEVFRLS